VSWEGHGHAASEFRRIQAKRQGLDWRHHLVALHQRGNLSGAEADPRGLRQQCRYLRVCHSPTGYGLGQTYGTSAGTQTFKSVEHSDVIMVIGANPAAHPVFGSRMKKRLRGERRAGA
jgi:formate dehydrogenase major subunit